MRALVFIVILAIVAVLAAVATGFVNVRNIRGGPPELIATRNSVTVKGAKAPAFDVEAGTVKIGSKTASVSTPTLEISKPTQRK